MYGDLGPYVDLVDNKDLPSDPVVAALFKQGLGQLYGFNLVESNRNFRTAAELDPACVLCHWGVAAAHSPSINYFILDQNSLNLAATKAMELMKQQSSKLSEKTKRLVTASSKLIAPANHTDSPQSPYRKHGLTRFAKTVMTQILRLSAQIVDGFDPMELLQGAEEDDMI